MSTAVSAIHVNSLVADNSASAHSASNTVLAEWPERSARPPCVHACVSERVGTENRSLEL
eukprot:3542919-Rhodomonas_salina.1